MNTKIALIVGFGAALLLSACGNSSATHVQTTAEARERGVPVEAITVERGLVRASFQASTVLEAEEETDVIARVSGVIEQILVEEGDYVEQGQALARMESARYQYSRDQIAAELNGVKQELDRMQRLATQQMVSQESIERLQTRHDSLTAQLKIADLDLTETVIRAPISGHIAHRFVKQGNMIQAYQPKALFHIVNDTTLRATLNLPEQALRQVKVGQNAELLLQGIGDNQILLAEVARISPTVDSNTGTFRVVLSIPNHEHKYRAGMFSRVLLHYAEKENVVRIPHQALIRIDQTAYVFVVENEKAVRKEVHPGLRENGWIEIVDGIDSGATLVVTGQNTLREDALVEVIAL
ncbi:efflux RND transporter periplasmic adaptor subunit [Aliidiomarina halalkaliphila]|uniref:Efflux RND transporter periplasmic adaptor subunit n=1 Tax=Aliidiomarina halalkaliphila TaxID=2593535 RepID=A0A552X3H5_9GAMM|nr:efflux RND transporter periplasmic adaptor subunit [Aliidiomarina halalkaliphila]TRW49516.1 efflux RND transporter periplasmic adaptor subunit [Aliidiomarina halalkaliphila]